MLFAKLESWTIFFKILELQFIQICFGKLNCSNVSVLRHFLFKIRTAHIWLTLFTRGGAPDFSRRVYDEFAHYKQVK